VCLDIVLLISNALVFIDTFPMYPFGFLLVLYALYLCYSLLFFTLIENKVHYMNVFFKRVIYCPKQKNLGFVCFSVSFTTPKCDFSKVLSCGLVYVEKERKMEWKQCKTGVKQV